MSLERFVTDISAETDTARLVEIIIDVFTTQFEIQLVNYGVYSSINEYDRFTEHPTGIFSHGALEWMNHYVEQNYFNVDAAFQYLNKGGHARTWNSFDRSVVFDEVSEFGSYDGLAIPLIGAGGTRAGLMLGGGTSLATPHLEAQLSAYATLFHARYDMVGRRIKDPRLTCLQVEILKWMGQDKSKTDIADILNLSSSNIDYHCREIYRKLEVGSKLGAVLKAMMVGLIDPEIDKIQTTQVRSRQ